MCFFQRHQTLSALWSSQSPVQGGSSVQAGSALCSEDQPWVCQNWYQLFSGLRCSTDKNLALNFGKLWFVLLYGELSYPISSIWLFPIICLFLSRFFQALNLSFSLTFHLPFPGSLSGTSQSIPVFILRKLCMFSFISWILLCTSCFPK